MEKATVKRQLASWISFLNSFLVLGIGVMHFPMAYDMAALPEYAGLAPNPSVLVLVSFICFVYFAIVAMTGSDKQKEGSGNNGFPG
ncbi:hypothetical protein KKA14_07130 [bacterium]|nr:hypothetical protein [bacterium]